MAVFFLPQQPSSASTIQNDVSGTLPGDPVGMNLPAGVGDAGKIPQATGQLSLGSTPTESTCAGARAPHLEKPLQ